MFNSFRFEHQKYWCLRNTFQLPEPKALCLETMVPSFTVTNYGPSLSYLLIESFPEPFFHCNLPTLYVSAARSKCQQLEKGLWVPVPEGLAVSNWRDRLLCKRPKCQQLGKTGCVDISLVNMIPCACMHMFISEL